MNFSFSIGHLKRPIPPTDIDHLVYARLDLGNEFTADNTLTTFLLGIAFLSGIALPNNFPNEQHTINTPYEGKQ